MNEIMNFSNPKDALEWAKIICKTRFCPKEFWERPEDVLIAIAYGSELGLKPLQALQNIAVINGKPSIYGDTMLAVCKNHPDFEWVKETYQETEQGACCIVKRKNQPEVCVVFNQHDAVNAGLWGKAGPWKQYPKRMLQMRARSFALRDCFPDVLKGLIAAEEAQDYSVANNKNDEIYNRILVLLDEKNVALDQINKWCAHAGVGALRELPASRMEKLVEHLEKLAPALPSVSGTVGAIVDEERRYGISYGNDEFYK